jgi:hypothetical protein
VLGLLCAASMLLGTQMEFGHSHTAYTIANRLPSWAAWTAAPPDRVPMLIVGFLCALLLVAGRWPIKVCAALAATWFIYAQAAFGSGSHWAEQLAQAFDFTPFRIGGLVGVAALIVVSVLALLMATRPAGAARSSHGAVVQAPLS